MGGKSVNNAATIRTREKFITQAFATRPCISA